MGDHHLSLYKMVTRFIREIACTPDDDDTVHPYRDIPLEEFVATKRQGERSRPDMFRLAEDFHERILGATPETVTEIQSGCQQVILMTALGDTKRVMGVSRDKRMDDMVRNDYLNIGRIAEFEGRTGRKPSTPQQYGLQSDERGAVWMAEFCEGYYEVNLDLRYTSGYPKWEVARTVIANGWNQNLTSRDLPPQTGDTILIEIVNHTLTVAHGTGLIGKPELNAGDYMWHPDKGIMIQCFRGENHASGLKTTGRQLEALIRNSTANIGGSALIGTDERYSTFDNSHVQAGFEQFVKNEKLSAQDLDTIKRAFWDCTRGCHWPQRDTILQNLFK